LMANRVGPQGAAVGIDPNTFFLDQAKREAARLGSGATFLAGPVGDLSDRHDYDLVYARFLLSHQPDPEGALARMVDAANPGGAIVIEDVDFAGHYPHPRCGAFDRYVELYRAVVRLRGADADIGPRLPGMLEDAGAEQVQFGVVQPSFRKG